MFLVSIFLAIASPCGLSPSLGDGLHPNDGPDADVRIRVREESVDVVVAFNLAFVDAIIDHPREDPDVLAQVEAETLRAILFEYIAANNEVAIDGVVVTPLDRGFEVLEAPDNLIPLFPRFGARALVKVQLDLEYTAKSMPAEVRLLWAPFPPDAVLATEEESPPVQIVAQFSAEGSESLITFTADEPEFTWLATGAAPTERFLVVPDAPGASGGMGRTIPGATIVLVLLGIGVLVGAMSSSSGSTLRRRGALVAIVCFGGSVAARNVARVPLYDAGGLPSVEEARAAFVPLHANIYRAFDFERESDVYDALARSVDGELLDELYNEVYRSLKNQEAGGAVSRVQAVHLLEAEVSEAAAIDDRPSFDVEALWQVEGSVYHWGHAHTRTNEYRALYGLRASEAGWRIASSQVLEERRVDAAPLGPLPPDGWPGWTSDEPLEEPNPMPEIIPPELKDL